MKKKVLFAVVFIMAAVCVLIFGLEWWEDRQATALYGQLLEEAREYEKEKAQILSEMKELERKAGYAENRKSWVLLGFDSSDQELYTHIYPKLKEHHMTGIIVLNPLEQGYGALTEEEYRTMTGDGWEVMYGGMMTGSLDAWKTEMRRIPEKPILYFYDCDEYINHWETLNQCLKELDIRYFAVSAPDSHKHKLVSRTEQENLYRIQNLRIEEGSVYIKEMLELACRNPTTVVITNYGSQGGSNKYGAPCAYEEPVYLEVLDYLEEKRKAGILETGTLAEYDRRKVQDDERAALRKKEYEAYAAEQEAVLEELDEKIDAVWRKYPRAGTP